MEVAHAPTVTHTLTFTTSDPAAHATDQMDIDMDIDLGPIDELDALQSQSVSRARHCVSPSLIPDSRLPFSLASIPPGPRMTVSPQPTHLNPTPRTSPLTNYTSEVLTI